MKTPVKLSVFLYPSDIMAKSIGLVPYDDDDDELKAKKFQKPMKWFFNALITNLNLILVAELMFTFKAALSGENFKEATMNLSYFGFGFVSSIKMFSVLHKKSLLTKLMNRIRQLYPVEPEKQAEFHTRDYAIKYNLISFGFVLIHEILIWSYNLFTAVSYLIYEYWLGLRTVPKVLPYYVWLPWQWQDHWSYYLLYISQNAAGHASMSMQLTNDLILCAVATQLIMHYRYLGQRIETYQPTQVYAKDQQFLRECIEYHEKILSLSKYMNEIFGVSLLVNFISSSFTMCFLGFQITIGVPLDTLCMLFIFLICSLLQILMICYYGEELIKKSESIGNAVYNHNWLKTDVRYRKMMLMIIERSQRPALLKATTFLTVSMGTMTDLMQLSYKFFALLRTMYLN